MFVVPRTLSQDLSIVKVDFFVIGWADHKNFPLIHSGAACGQVKVKENDTISSKIFNGKTALAGSLPWMAYILINTGFVCFADINRSKLNHKT